MYGGRAEKLNQMREIGRYNTHDKPTARRNTGYVVQRTERARRGRNSPQCPQSVCFYILNRARRKTHCHHERCPKRAVAARFFWRIDDARVVPSDAPGDMQVPG
jgi:hypothetical protein